MTGAALGRRDRKRMANRDAIRSAALQLFMDRGFDDVSIAEIADTVDLAERTVYRHFPTKEDLALARLAERQADFVAVLDRQPGGTTLGEMLMNATIECDQDPDQQALLASETALIVATPALLARMHQMMAEWEAPITQRLADCCGRPPNDLELLQLAALYCSTIWIVIREWATGNTTLDIVDYGRRSIETLNLLPAANIVAR